jgi:hypothetical protein
MKFDHEVPGRVPGDEYSPVTSDLSRRPQQKYSLFKLLFHAGPVPDTNSKSIRDRITTGCIFVLRREGDA